MRKEDYVISLLVHGNLLVRVFGYKVGIFVTNFFQKKLQNTVRFVIIRPNNILLDTLTFYLPENMLKTTETSKKIKREKK